MPKKITVLHVKVGRKPEVVEVDDDLKSLQSLVGGYVEPVRIAPGVEFVVNETGRLDDLPVNHTFPIPGGDTIRGDFFICAPGFRSLSPANLAKYAKHYGG